MKRSTDSEKLNQASHGTIHISGILFLTAFLACLLSATLMYTILRLGKLVSRVVTVMGLERTALEAMMTRQRVLTVLLLGLVLVNVLSVTLLILLPLRKYIAQIRENRLLTMRGAYELRYLAEAYNLMTEENRKHNEALRYMAEHDALTGLLNRGAFERLREKLAYDAIAMLLIDVDNFKDFNDRYGHDMGDRVLQKVASLLARGFRAGDYPCRIGGDEFAVFMVAMNPGMKDAIDRKVERIAKILREPEDGLPVITLSVGVAFSRQCAPEDDIFRLADAALYRVKEHGRDGCAFFDPAVDRVQEGGMWKPSQTEDAPVSSESERGGDA